MNRRLYGLENAAHLEALLEDLPDARPDWSAVLDITRELVLLDEQRLVSRPRTFPLKVLDTLQRLEEPLARLDIPGPSSSLTGQALTVALASFTNETLTPWAEGRWPAAPTTTTGRR